MPSAETWNKRAVEPTAVAVGADASEQGQLPLDASARPEALLQLAEEIGSEAGVAEREQLHRRVLLFWSVGSKPEVMELVRQGLAHLRETAGRKCCDVFLAHYDGTASLWRRKLPEWYDREVTFSRTDVGFKFELIQEYFTKEGSAAWPARYEYIWALDEDIDVRGTDFGELLRLADRADAYITGPAFTQASGHIVWRIQEPRKDCDFRYTNYVEVIAPLIRTQALRSILVDCEHCIHRKTIWGLDGIWCGFVAHQQKRKSHRNACAVLDRTPVFHRDFRTLRGKYVKGSAAENPTFRADGLSDLRDVAAHHVGLYVRPWEQKTLECVRHSGSDALSASVPGGHDVPSRKKLSIHAQKHHPAKLRGRARSSG